MAIPPPDQWHLLPKTRAEATALGMKHFLKTCMRGHTAPHWTSNSHCSDCNVEDKHVRTKKGIRELTTEGHYGGDAAQRRAWPSNSPKARREQIMKLKEQHRLNYQLKKDRCPPNQSKEERKAVKAFEDAVRARGNQPDHIVPFFHPRLRGLHTLANLQELTPRQNRIKGNRIMTVAQIQQELESGVRMAEPTEADLKAMVDGGLAVWPEDVDEDYEHTTTPGKVNWANYPQHMVTDNE